MNKRDAVSMALPLAILILGVMAGTVSAQVGARVEVLNTNSPWRVYWRNGNRLAGINGRYICPHDTFERMRNDDPDGAIPTARYEMMRAGLCEAEAMIYVENNARNPKLPSALSARANGVRPRLIKAIRALSQQSSGITWESEVANLYQTAADMQATLGNTQ